MTNTGEAASETELKMDCISDEEMADKGFVSTLSILFGSVVCWYYA